MEFDFLSATAWLQLFITTSLFVIAAFGAFVIPGCVVLGKFFRDHTPFEKFVVYTAMGIVLWAYQGVIFGYLGIRAMSYVYLLIFFLFFILKRYPNSLRNTVRIVLSSRIDAVVCILFAVGVFGQVNRFIPTGFLFPEGLYVATFAADDAFWHASLTNQLVINFPPEEPGFTGVNVYNYHYWSNLVTAEMVRVFRLPLFTTQFVYIYTLLSFLIGGLTYTFARSIGLKRAGVYLAVYLQYFSSDIIYLTSFVTKRAFEFSVHPLEDGTMFLENPPRAFSYVIMLLGILLLMRFLKTKSTALGLVTALTLGSVIGYKVHTGIMIIGATAVLCLYSMYTKDRKTLFLCLLIFFVSVCVYLPVNHGSGLPVYAPFEMPRMFAAQDKLGLSFLELRRRVYQDFGNNVRALEMDLLMLGIFLISQFGIKNIGWIGIRQSMKKLGKPAFLFMLSGAIISIVFGTLFIQPVAFADIFNSYLAAYLFLWIFAAILLDGWLRVQSGTARAVIILTIFVVSLPRWVYKTTRAAGNDNGFLPSVTRGEISAMRYIKEHTDPQSVVFVANSGQWDGLYPYVSIFTDRPMFLSGQGILDRHGIPHEDRSRTAQKLLTSSDPIEVRRYIRDSDIDVLYFYGNPELPAGLNGIGSKKIFENASNTIYEIPDE